MGKRRFKASSSHGREASKPQQIPPRGWKDIGIRVYRELIKDNIPILAAGVAFYAFVAIFPAIAAIISIYGLVVDPQTVQQQLSQLANILPAQSRILIQQQLTQIVSSPSALSWGLALSIVLSLWSANAGMKALFQGLDIAYDETEKRNFFKLNALTLLFTLLGVVVAIISMTLIVVLPAAINALPIPSDIKTLMSWGKWILLAGLIIFYLASLYHYAPDRVRPKWGWVSWGSVIATVLWMLGSMAFSFYVSNFGNYNATYGSLAAVVILLFWLYLSCFSILLGAEINSEMERQTLKDTTVGKEKPLGRRGARSADDLGEAA